MRQIIEAGVARVGATIQNIGANLDYEMLSLPGGSVIAVLLWIYGNARHSADVDGGHKKGRALRKTRP